MRQIVEKVAQRIASAQNILIICHIAPDGDAIGSLLGLGLALQQRGHQITMACQDPVPFMYRHLSQWETITDFPQGDFDLVIGVDCSDLERFGTAYNPTALAGVPIINIDHHTTNIRFGLINWVDTQAAATAQMLLDLIQTLRVPLSVDTATCLLNGILTDTLGFRTSNTTAEVMESAVTLIRAGAPLSDLTHQVFNHRPLSVMQMWATALNKMRLEGHVIWTQISQEMRAQIGYKENGDAGLANFMCTANEADIAVTFDELEDGRVNVSMRAVPGYNVSQVALHLGGGGHPQAAGCTLDSSLEEAQRQVLPLLDQAWEEQTPKE